ncbi:MAG: hypothetical protein HC853_10045 [Anaerolineae bacterium]|nr:hypothetical protein [Anaerolineae bacterium]
MAVSPRIAIDAMGGDTGPAVIIAWLANELPNYGKQLKRGDFVTTGVVCDVYPAQQGDTMTADFGVMGRGELAFE